MDTSKLQKRIMRRVYIAWIAQSLSSPVLIKLYIVAILFWQSLSYISLPNIFLNSFELADFTAYTAFIWSAIIHTEGIMQIIIAGMFVALALLLRDIYISGQYRLKIHISSLLHFQ